MEELLHHLPERGHQGLDGIRGISFLGRDGEVTTTPPRPQIRPLSELPWPDREAIDVEAYLRAWRDHHGHASMSLITARGCPYTCTWCSHAVYGQTHRRRTVAEVADEVAHLAERWGPERLWYADDVFTLHRPWTLEYAAELRRRDLHLPFECISRADRINERIADALAEMGCFRLWIGSESGSQRMLDAMKRLTSVEDVQRKTAMLQERGIDVGMFIMLGYEGEQEADIAATIEHLKAADPDIFLTTLAYPITGTPYHTQVERKIRTDRPWEERTDRDLRIVGRHSQRYYDHATRWMVNEVKLHRALRSGSRNPVSLGRMFLAARRGRLGMLITRREREEQRLRNPSGRGWAPEEQRAREGLG
jgi:radical SAM superfamily enzyme YgiQ (UPF0313 family)